MGRTDAPLKTPHAAVQRMAVTLGVDQADLSLPASTCDIDLNVTEGAHLLPCPTCHQHRGIPFREQREN